MNKELTLDDKNLIVMKLLHYFITEKNYNPIILQGVDNEIWLENLNENYEIIRIVSNHIHNDEQYDFDVFKTKRIVKKIKNKTFSLNMNVFSFFLDMGDSVTVDLNQENVLNGIKITDEKDIVVNENYENNWIVESGLDWDDVVIMSGIQDIYKSGQKVKPIPYNKDNNDNENKKNKK